MLFYIGVKFEETIYRCGPAPEYSRDEWFYQKPNMGMPFPNLPYLIDEGVKLSETVAIMRYICAKWMPELLGKDPAVMGTVDMLQPLIQ